MLCFVVIFCVHCRRNYGRTTFYCNLVFYLSFLCNFTIFTFLNGKIYLHIREEMEIDVCNESAPIHLVSQIPFNYTLKVNITIAVCAATNGTCWWKLNWGRLPDVLRTPLEWHLLSSEQKKKHVSFHPLFTTLPIQLFSQHTHSPETTAFKVPKFCVGKFHLKRRINFYTKSMNVWHTSFQAALRANHVLHDRHTLPELPVLPDRVHQYHGRGLQRSVWRT